jgi:hypothetical protein
VRDILVGTLVIDMADATKGRLAWRGMATKEASTRRRSRQAGQEHHQRGEQDFQNYPPKQKASVSAHSGCMGTIVRRTFATIILLMLCGLVVRAVAGRL